MQEIALEGKFKKMARIGYVARGVIYLVIGGLALMAAFGEGGQTTNSKGAILKILQQPFGYVLLGLLIVGLLAYAAWRAVQAIKDADQHGTDAKGLAIRGGLLVSCITHLLLAFWALTLMFGSGSGSSQGGGQSFISGAFGQVLLAIAAVAVAGAAVAHLYKGWTAGFEKYVHLPAKHSSWARPLCRFGLMARGVVWAIIAWFLIDAAMQARTGDIQGMGDALRALRDSGYGPWLLGIVAAGLFAFGVYSVLEALYRRIDTGSSSQSGSGQRYAY